MAFLTFPGSKNPWVRCALLIAGLLAVCVAIFTTRPEMPSEYHYQVQLKNSNADLAVNATTPFPQFTPETELSMSRLNYAENLELDDRHRTRPLIDWIPVMGAAIPYLTAYTDTELSQQARKRYQYTINKLVREPQRWRGTIISGWGLVDEIRVANFPDLPKSSQQLYRMRVYDPRLQGYFTLITPLVSQTVVAGRSGIGFDGIFCGRFSEISEGQRLQTALVIARKATVVPEGGIPAVVLDERGDPGEYVEITPSTTRQQLNQAYLNDIFVNGQGLRRLNGARWNLADAGDISADYLALVHIFEYLYHFKPGEIAKLVKPELTYQSLMANKSQTEPAWLRGSPLHCRIRVIDCRTLRFTNTGASSDNIPRMHLITGYDPDLNTSSLWTLLVLNLPAGLKQDDTLSVDAVYIRQLPWKDRNSNWVWSPLIAARDSDVIIQSESKLWSYLAVIFVLVVLIAIIHFARQASKEMRELDSMVNQRRLASAGAFGAKLKDKKEGNDKE